MGDRTYYINMLYKVQKRKILDLLRIIIFMEPYITGEYKIELYVKDKSFSGDYEDKKICRLYSKSN